MSELVDSFMEHHPISPVGTTIKPDQLKAVQKEVRSLRTQLAKANERVAELEFKGSLAYSEETGFIDLNKFALEQKIEAVNKVLGSERFELENRPFDFVVRVESIEIILKNLEIELNSEQLRKEQY